METSSAAIAVTENCSRIGAGTAASSGATNNAHRLQATTRVRGSDMDPRVCSGRNESVSGTG